MAVCWDRRRSGWRDAESGVWLLEWQLARYSDGIWDTISPTQTLTPERTLDVLRNGRLDLNASELSAAAGLQVPKHPNTYRLGVRAVNRAGLRSCPGTALSCDQLPPGTDSPWAATDHNYTATLMIDIAPPICAYAKSWLCPLASQTPAGEPFEKCLDLSLDRAYGPVRVAGGGVQNETGRLLVQWQGFRDSESGVETCDLHVLRASNPGKTPLGHRCVISISQPAPLGDCARPPWPDDDGQTRCVEYTPALKAKLQATGVRWGRRVLRQVAPIRSPVQ